MNKITTAILCAFLLAQISPAAFSQNKRPLVRRIYVLNGGGLSNTPGSYIGGDTLGRSADQSGGGAPGLNGFNLQKTQFSPSVGQPSDRLSREGPAANTGGAPQAASSAGSAGGGSGLPNTVLGPYCRHPGDGMRSDLGKKANGEEALNAPRKATAVELRKTGPMAPARRPAAGEVYSYPGVDPYGPGSTTKTGARHF